MEAVWSAVEEQKCFENISGNIFILIIPFFQYIGTLDVPRPSGRTEIVIAMRRIRVCKYSFFYLLIDWDHAIFLSELASPVVLFRFCAIMCQLVSSLSLVSFTVVADFIWQSYLSQLVHFLLRISTYVITVDQSSLSYHRLSLTLA